MQDDVPQEGGHKAVCQSQDGAPSSINALLHQDKFPHLTSALSSACLCCLRSEQSTVSFFLSCVSSALKLSMSAFPNLLLYDLCTEIVRRRFLDSYCRVQ